MRDHNSYLKVNRALSSCGQRPERSLVCLCLVWLSLADITVDFIDDNGQNIRFSCLNSKIKQGLHERAQRRAVDNEDGKESEGYRKSSLTFK